MRALGNFFLVLFFCGLSCASLSQTYPSALVTNLTGARSLFLDEFADPFQPKIRTTIYFTDYTASSWQFALSLKITGPGGILISTRAGARPPIPLEVAPGQPYVVEGADLSFYFNYDNLIFSGISRQQLELTHRLPEGFYTFCFEAVDYESGRPLSLPSCAGAYLSLLDPPVILLPQHAQVVENISMQNILFQWQPGNVTGNMSPGQVSYELNLYEVTGNWTNPVTAILNNQALLIWQSLPLQQTTFLYSLSEPPLEKGKRYVFTVRAADGSGRSRFKNNGYSMPRFFRYGFIENDTLLLSDPEEDFQFTLGSPSVFSWSKPKKALPGQMITYTLRVVRIDSLQSPESAMLYNTPFFQQSFLPTNSNHIQKTIPVIIWANIKRMERYAWQVKAESGVQQVAASEIRTFTGPPEIENFIAGGFVMTVTRLDYFDKQSNIVSGRCSTPLHPNGQPAEFGFSMIGLASIGSNEWVMEEGVISDRISVPGYTLSPDSVAENKMAWFRCDSVRVTPDVLKVGGRLHFELPFLNAAGESQELVSRRCLLSLSNLSFRLTGNAPVLLSDNYDVQLFDPLGFRLRIGQSSSFNVYQSAYYGNFNGFVQLPQKVQTVSGTPVHIAFSNAQQLLYVSESLNPGSEAVGIARNTGIELQPLSYVLDLDEERSPGDLAGEAGWKGLMINAASFLMPARTELSGQINASSELTRTVVNSPSDNVIAHVDHRGLFFRCHFSFQTSDSLRFNSFQSTQSAFNVSIAAGEIEHAAITGSILIPVIDTAAAFPYVIDLHDSGFGEGFLAGGLSGRTFTFNASGSNEQRIKVRICRALFRNRNRLEMDIDLEWPHFNLSIPGVQRFCAWGNNNIGFGIPNGRHALVQQGNGKAAGFDITVDNIGCGRSGNVYAFGMSAKINMDEEISGESGAPVMNAYSIYRNPLLTGTLSIPVTSLQAVVGGSSSPTNIGGAQAVPGTSGYTAAVMSGMSDAMGELGFIPGDTITHNYFDDPGTDPLISGNVVTQAGNVIKILVRLKPFIGDRVTDKDWEVLDRLSRIMESDVVRQAQATNAKGVLNFALNKALEGLISHLTSRIEGIGQLAVGKVRSAINSKIAGPVNNKIDATLTSVVDRLQKQALLQVDEQYHPAVISTFSVVKTNISNAVRSSVLTSFETNITSKLDKAVQACVVSKITSYVRKEVSLAGQQLIASGANAQINIQEILVNGGSMFGDVADTVKDVIMQLNGHNFVSTAESLVEDAITGINWDQVSSQIVNELLSKSVPQLIASQLSGAIAENAGTYASVVLSTVKFDFTNLGEKLQNGQLDKVVKFDPTNIYLQSPAVDVRGTLVFTKADPVYGDSWQANVLVRVKVPRKDNPIECSAYFINGKTTQGPVFTYWLVKLGVSGLAIPLTPAPLLWDGAEGCVYSKMKKTGTSAIPDATNKFGVSCRFTFLDQQSSGGTLILSLGAEAEFNDAGFAIQLSGDASMLNFQKEGQKYRSPGFVTGTGTIGYYKTAQCTKVAGDFNVQLNTQPVLCAGGNAGFDLRGANDWKIWVGTQSSPFAVKLLCKDFLMNSAHLQAGNSGFAAGIMANVNLNAQSPWIQFTGVRVRGFATFGFGYNVSSSIVWEPAFQIAEASVSAWVSASLGVDYQTAAGEGSITLAGVSLSGILTYRSQPESELHGQLSGSITVVGFNVGFDTPVNYSLSKQQIIN